MKKVLLMIIVGGAVALTSCSKGDLECTCTSSSTTVSGGVSTTTQGGTTVTKMEGVKKHVAAANCQAESVTTDTGGSGNFAYTTTTTTTCDLK